MEFNKINTLSTETIVKAQQEFMTKVYGWMVGGLLLTGLTAWYVFESAITYMLIENTILFFALIIGELILVYVLSARINSLSKTTASLMFVGYSLLNGLTLSVIFLAYTAESIQNVFLIAASMFAALSIYGYTTKREMGGFGKFLYMGLVGLVVAMIINFIIGSSMLNFVISIIGVIVFAGLTVYDTNKLKEMYLLQFEGDEVASKGAIIGALVLYLDFINLFLFLLRLLGSRR